MYECDDTKQAGEYDSPGRPALNIRSFKNRTSAKACRNEFKS